MKQFLGLAVSNYSVLSTKLRRIRRDDRNALLFGGLIAIWLFCLLILPNLPKR